MTVLSLEEKATKARQRWMGVLARAGAAALESYWSEFEPDQQAAIEPLQAPQAGLVMVRGRAGGTGQRFNLGEMTVTRCSVKLADGPVGHGYVRGRNERHAQLAACFDALLQSPSGRDRLLAEMIEPLAAAQLAAAAKNSRKAAATKVDFFTLVRGEDDEQ